MLSGIASYIFGVSGEEDSFVDAASLAEQIRLKTTQADDDEWMIVDKASRCTSRSASPMAAVTPSDSSSTSSSQYHVQANTTDCDSDATDLSSPLERVTNPSLGESWLVTPPPCFTAGSSSPINPHPMENLLIEHPSMSVYHSSRGRASSQGIDSDSSSTSESEEQVVPRPPRSVLVARTVLTSPSTKAMQRKLLRHEALKSTRHQLQRSNRVQHYNKSSSRRAKHNLLQPCRRSNDRRQ